MDHEQTRLSNIGSLFGYSVNISSLGIRSGYGNGDRNTNYDDHRCLPIPITHIDASPYPDTGFTYQYPVLADLHRYPIIDAITNSRHY